jgi:hypothetical protein
MGGRDDKKREKTKTCNIEAVVERGGGGWLMWCSSPSGTRVTGMMKAEVLLQLPSSQVSRLVLGRQAQPGRCRNSVSQICLRPLSFEPCAGMYRKAVGRRGIAGGGMGPLVTCCCCCPLAQSVSKADAPAARSPTEEPIAVLVEGRPSSTESQDDDLHMRQRRNRAMFFFMTREKQQVPDELPECHVLDGPFPSLIPIQ